MPSPSEPLRRWEWEGGAVVDIGLDHEPEAGPVVVCGVDGSPDGEDAARAAAELATLAEARLTLVTVAQVPVVHGAAAVPGARQELRAGVVAAGEALLEQAAAAVGRQMPVDRLLAIGDPARELVGVAEQTHAMAIVVGTRGLGTLRTAMLGSVAAAVCRRAPCPVVVVPRGAASWAGLPAARALARGRRPGPGRRR